MLPFRHIVFPVDYSKPCEAVIPYVQDMIKRFSAGLTLVHATGLGLAALGYTGLSIADPDWQERSRSFDEARLREFGREAFPNQHVESIVEVGDPGSVIDKVVRHQGADLVMIPTHGVGPVRRFLLGSVTAKVLHDISAAVWTGVNDALTEHQPGIPYQSILCAVENAGEAEAVVRAAAALAECYRAQLSLAHVVEMPSGSANLDFGPYKKELMDAADHWLREMKGSLGLDLPHAVIDSDTAGGIRQVAIERKVDLIVTGRGCSQDTFGRIWSRLYSIIRESPCPVVSI